MPEMQVDIMFVNATQSVRLQIGRAGKYECFGRKTNAPGFAQN